MAYTNRIRYLAKWKNSSRMEIKPNGKKLRGHMTKAKYFSPSSSCFFFLYLNDHHYCYYCRWIKFEEDVEEGGNRWSKPHVATLSLHSLFELRSFLLNGTVMLDMEVTSLEQIADLILDNMVNSGSLTLESKDKVRRNNITL